MKYKIGDKVKVVKKLQNRYLSWVNRMDLTIGKTYTIIHVSHRGSYELQTDSGNWYYLSESLMKCPVKGEQLLFPFMKDAEFNWVEF